MIKLPFKRGRGDDRKSLGARGEDIARRALRKQGFIILDMNYRCHIGELDIVARKSDLIVFVEVKTRKSDQFGPPELAVTETKQRKIIRLSNFYIKHKKLHGLRYRYDVIAVRWDERGKPAVDHMPAAFDAST